MTPAERGRIAYVTTCMACHNRDPNLAGTKGPPIAGSSRELVADRILYLKYPDGYKPKRTTHNMRAQPQLKNKIDDLVAFLAEAANKTEAAKNQPVKTEAAKNETAKSDAVKNDAAKKK